MKKIPKRKEESIEKGGMGKRSILKVCEEMGVDFGGMEIAIKKLM
jgi:hypothetical protein